jgi:hypothetical protein
MPKPALAVSAVFQEIICPASILLRRIPQFPAARRGAGSQNSWLILTDLRCQRVRTSLRFYVMS